MSVFMHAPTDLDPNEAPPRLRRSWNEKLNAAWRGVKLGIRGHSSFFVHFFFAALGLATAIVLHCQILEWCILLGCIGMVLTAEMFNSALETLTRGLDVLTRKRVGPCLDIAAGATLIVSITAAILGGLVFIHRLALVLGFLPISILDSQPAL